MADAIEYEQFDQTAAAGGGVARAGDPDLSRLTDIPMELSVEIGRTHMTVGETLDLSVGSIVALERQAGEAVELLVNGTAIARGEVIVVDEQYGLRVTEILDGQRDGESSASAAAGNGPAADEQAAAQAGSKPAEDTSAEEG